MSRYGFVESPVRDVVAVADTEVVPALPDESLFTKTQELVVTSTHVAVHEFWLEHKGVMHDEILVQREAMLWEIKRIEEEMLSQAVMFREKSEAEMVFLREESSEIVSKLLTMEVAAWQGVKKRELELFSLQTGFTDCMGGVVRRLIEREFALAQREKSLWERRYELENWSVKLHSSMVTREMGVKDQARNAQMDIALLQQRKRNRISTSNAAAYIEVLNEDIARIAGSESFSVSGKVVPISMTKVHHTLLDEVESDDSESIKRTISGSTARSDTMTKRTSSMRSVRSAGTRSNKTSASAMPSRRGTSSRSKPKAEPKKRQLIEEVVVETTPQYSEFEGLPITLSYLEGVGGRLRGTVVTTIGADGTFTFPNVSCCPTQRVNAISTTTIILTESGREKSKTVANEKEIQPQTDLSGHSNALRLSIPVQQNLAVEDAEVVVSIKCKTVQIRRRRLLDSHERQEEGAASNQLQSFMSGAATATDVVTTPERPTTTTSDTELVTAVNFAATGEWNPSVMSLRGSLNFLNIERFGLFGTEVKVRLRCTTSTNEQLDILPSVDHKQQRSSSQETATSTALSILSHETPSDNVFNTESTAHMSTNPTIGDPEGQNVNNPVFDIRTTIRCLGNESNQFPFDFNLLCVPGCPATWSQLIQPTDIRRGLFSHDDPEEKRESRRAPRICRFFIQISVPQTRYSESFEHEFEINVLEMISERPYFIYEAASVLDERCDATHPNNNNNNDTTTPPPAMITMAEVALPPPPPLPQPPAVADSTTTPNNKPTKEADDDIVVTPPPPTKVPSSGDMQLTLSRNSSLRRSASPHSAAGSLEPDEVENPPTFQLSTQSVPIPLHDCVQKCKLSAGGDYMAVVDTAGNIRIYRKRRAASKTEAFVLGSPDSTAVAAVVASSPNREHSKESFRDASPSPKRHTSSLLAVPSEHELRRSASNVAAVQGSSDEDATPSGEEEFFYWQEQMYVESGRGNSFTQIFWSTPVGEAGPEGKGSHMDYLAAYESSSKRVYIWYLRTLRTFAATEAKSKDRSPHGSQAHLNSPTRANPDLHHEGGASGHKNAFSTTLASCRAACFAECSLEDEAWAHLCVGLGSQSEESKKSKRPTMHSSLSAFRATSASPFAGSHLVNLVFVTPSGEVVVAEPHNPSDDAQKEASFAGSQILPNLPDENQFSRVIKLVCTQRRAAPARRLLVSSVALSRDGVHLVLTASSEAADVAVPKDASQSLLRLGAAEVVTTVCDLNSGREVTTFDVEALVELPRALRKAAKSKSSEPITVSTPLLRYCGSTASPQLGGGTADTHEHHYYCYPLGLVVMTMSSQGGFTIAHLDAEQLGVTNGDGSISNIATILPIEGRKVSVVYITNDVFVLDLSEGVRDSKGFVADADHDVKDPYLIQTFSMNPTDDNMSSPASAALDPTTISTACSSAKGKYVIVAVDGMGPLCWQFSRRAYVAPVDGSMSDTQ